MDATRVARRPRVIGRGKVSKPEQDKENRGRRPVGRRIVSNKSCSEKTLSTLHRRQSVEMCEGPLVGRNDGSKVSKPRGRRLTIVKKGQTTRVTSNKGLRNDLKVKVLNEAEMEVDVARNVTKRKKMVQIQPVLASPSEDKLPLKVPNNTPIDKSPTACKISEDDMIFLMRQVNVNDFFDVSMETDSSLLSPDGYQSDILSYLKERENLIAMRSSSVQPNVDTIHREILVDWLIDVQVHLDLENETLHLAVAMMDAYLLDRSISLHYLQLLGITCLFVASKYEEIYVPNLETLCRLCAHSYKEGEFLIMERRILRTLEYNLFFPTAVNFLAQYLSLTGNEDERLALMCNYLVDLTLPCCHSKNSCPSLWAAAALFLALTIQRSETRHKSDDNNDLQIDLLRVNVTNDQTVWDRELQAVTGYTEFYLTELAKAMVEKVLAIKGAKYRASYRKYNTESYQYISEELAKWCSSTEHLASHDLLPMDHSSTHY